MPLPLRIPKGIERAAAVFESRVIAELLVGRRSAVDEQRAVAIRAAWFAAGEPPEGAGEAAAQVDIEQDIRKPDPAPAALDQPAQGPRLGGDDEDIGAVQAQLIDAGNAVGR